MAGSDELPEFVACVPIAVVCERKRLIVPKVERVRVRARDGAQSRRRALMLWHVHQRIEFLHELNCEI